MRCFALKEKEARVLQDTRDSSMASGFAGDTIRLSISERSYENDCFDNG